MTSEHATGRPLRCPACGQPLRDMDRGHCRLCGYEVDEAHVTSEDTTPYALARRENRPAWRTMVRWMWALGSVRLSHLSLMRTSPEARRFSRANVFWISLAAAVACAALSGWHGVKPVDTAAGLSRTPSGTGWLMVVQGPIAFGGQMTEAGRIVTLWWNPVWASIRAAVILTAICGMAFLGLGMLRSAINASLGPRYGHQDRLGAAVRYSTAWALPLVPALIVLAGLPLCRMAEVGHWTFQPPAEVVYGAAGILAAIAVFMGWFGWLRLAMTVPKRVRLRVILACTIWIPVAWCGLVAALAWGLVNFERALLPALRLNW